MRIGVCLHAGSVTRGPLRLHPSDRAAMASGLAVGAEVIVVEAVGDRGTAPRAAGEALAAGAARAVRIVDPALVTASAQATAFVLATALDALQVDLVLFGNDADPEGAHDVPACIALHMSAVYVEDVLELKLEDTAPASSTPSVSLTARSAGRIRRLRVPLNAVVGIAADLAPVTGPAVATALSATPPVVEVFSLAEINVDPAQVRSRQDRRGAIDPAARPLVALNSAAAIAALLRR